jgi:hypothetical protein
MSTEYHYRRASDVTTEPGVHGCILNSGSLKQREIHVGKMNTSGSKRAMAKDYHGSKMLLRLRNAQ